MLSDLLDRLINGVSERANITSGCRRATRFGSFGAGSVVRFPYEAIYNEHAIRVGAGTMIGRRVTMSVGMAPGQPLVADTILTIGDRCLIGRGSGIVAHLSIEIGDDVFTGHQIYITDQNHGWGDPDLPISRQIAPERPVRVGSGSWIGHGAVILPGAQIGERCVIGANSVVTGVIPAGSIAVGAPARVIASTD